MSGLLSDLQVNAKAMNAHANGVQTAGRNLSNINNADYARQRVILGDRGVYKARVGVRSLGLEALGLEHVRDEILDLQIVREIMNRGSLEAQNDFQKKIQAALGETVDRQGDAAILDGAADTSLVPAGLSKAIDDLFNGFHELTSSPGSVTTKQIVIQRAEILAERFHKVDQRLVDLDADMVSQINTDVAAADRILETVADLNHEIARFEVNDPGSALDLRDQRQAALQELAELINFEVRKIPDGHGQIQIVGKDGSSGDVMLVDGAKKRGSLQFDGTNVAFGGSATVLDVSGGSLHGLIDLRAQTQSGLRTDLDLLTGQLVISINQAYNPSGLTGDFFAGAGLTAASIQLESGLTPSNLKTTDTSDVGANELAMAVATIGEQTFSTSSGDNFDGTAIDFLAGVTASVGLKINGLDERLENQSLVEGLLREQRASISSVSLDEEMTDLLRFQRAYQASARVINVIDKMIETIVEGLGR